MDLDTDSNPDNAFFVIDLQEDNQQKTLHPFFKDKKSKRSHKTVGIKVFLTTFA
jgi:hypothetical protein